MERADVVVYAANKLRASHGPAPTGEHGESQLVRAGELLDHIRGALGVPIYEAPASDPMLGGARARFQPWIPGQPDQGGSIWVDEALDAETRTFAVAHELGHFVLHRGEGILTSPRCQPDEINERADATSLRASSHPVEEYSPRVRRELEANTFAAELLAPGAGVRRLWASRDEVTPEWLATRLGISVTLAHHRLIAAVLGRARPHLVTDQAAHAPSPAAARASDLLDRLDPSQREAARSTGPALVVAGPGTGKTATLVGRVGHLVGERNVPPERVLALTFSNRAAGEMRERLTTSGLPGERIPVMTIHAFAATLLREYAPRVPHHAGEAPLQPDFRILDETDSLLLMEELLPELGLNHYRSLGNPTRHLRTLLTDFSRARDALHTPEAYLELVERMPLAQPTDGYLGSSATPASTRAHTTDAGEESDAAFTREQIARARERALAYTVWDRALPARGLVDFGGLIQRAIELLRAGADVLADVRRRYPEVLVDEFQDTNAAAGELLLLLAGDEGHGLWVVGDRQQAIYRWRGASPANIGRLLTRYPAMRVHRLQFNYRSVPEIVRLGSALAAAMVTRAPAGGADSPALDPIALTPVRAAHAAVPIMRGETFATDTHETVGLAQAVERRRGAGYRYGDQAILCRTNKQVARLAGALSATGIPVSEVGEFFNRPEVKDALALLALAAGPDGRGLLRAAPLITALGYQPPAGDGLAALARTLAAAHQPLPGALKRADVLLAAMRAAGITDPAGARGLSELGQAAYAMRWVQRTGDELARFLLLPRGYAWRLLRRADGYESSPATPHEAAEAQRALAALGELVRLAMRFDLRWAREDDFRRRLTRMVQRRHQVSLPDVSRGDHPRPAAPDSDTLAPGADVLPIATPDEMEAPGGGQPSGGSGGPGAVPVVCCFLRYLDALRAAGVEVTVPAGDDDALQVMTIHASKGLEFPVVYLPHLAAGQFPGARHGPEEVSPPGFHDAAEGEDTLAEERSLFFVGATRARDLLVLTRAGRYRSSSAQPSPLLGLIEDAPEYQEAASLVTPGELERINEIVAAQAGAHETASDGDDATGDIPMRTPESTQGRPKPRIPLRDLLQYLECPRQYKYARVYQLLDPTEDAVYRFHRYVRKGQRTLRDVRAEAPTATWEAAEARLRQLWESVGPAGHPYATFYWDYAQALLQHEWRTVGAEAPDATNANVLLAEPLEAELETCIVEVTADRVITGEAHAPTTLVRLHTGRPKSADAQDVTLALYELAWRQRHPDQPVRIELAYPASFLDDALPDTTARGDYLHMDVTDDARKVVETYLKPGRRKRSRLDKLDAAALGILHARFEARPSDTRCPTCAYCHICPADPADAHPPGAESESLPATISAPGGAGQIAPPRL